MNNSQLRIIRKNASGCLSCYRAYKLTCGHRKEARAKWQAIQYWAEKLQECMQVMKINITLNGVYRVLSIDAQSIREEME